VRCEVGTPLAEYPYVQPMDLINVGPPGYSFPMTPPRNVLVDRPQFGALLIGVLLSTFAGLTVAVPATNITAHNVLHHLNFLPLMIAGMLFGWRGAAYASVFAFAANIPGIARHWVEWPLDAKDQLVELTIFSAAGLIAGYLSDRERAQRRNLEKTQKELEGVYLELRANVAEMKKAERLSAAGRLAASLAHEIRNPLASISGAAGILQRGAAPPEYQRDSLDIIQLESQRLNKLLTGFLNFAKPRSPRLQTTDLNELMLSVLSLATHTAEASNITLAYSQAAQAMEIACDPEQLKQVLLNLVINAIDASPAGSEIALRTLANPGWKIIEVEDGGSGIPEDAVDRIFDPFFTTKPKGTGLGLAISSMIVSQHNGILSFRENQRRGTTFRIELPTNQEPGHAH
jgi:two-component system, NtrC family, sensor histidine kinase HydH